MKAPQLSPRAQVVAVILALVAGAGALQTSLLYDELDTLREVLAEEDGPTVAGDVSEGVILWDLSGADPVLVWSNPQASAMVGFALDARLGGTLAEVFPEIPATDCERYEEVFRDTIRVRRRISLGTGAVYDGQRFALVATPLSDTLAAGVFVPWGEGDGTGLEPGAYLDAQLDAVDAVLEAAGE